MENIWIAVLIVLAAAAFILWRKGIFRAKKATDAPASLTTTEIKDKLASAVMVDFKTTPEGGKVSSVVPIPDEVLPIIDAAANVRTEVINRLFPLWTMPQMDILFIEPDGITASGFPFLSVSGVQTAGTVVFGARTFLLLPHHAGINWGNFSYLFWSVYNESEHQSEFTNRDKEPVNRYLEFVTLEDVHPHDEIPPDIILPDYATNQARSLTDMPRPNCGVKWSDEV